MSLETSRSCGGSHDRASLKGDITLVTHPSKPADFSLGRLDGVSDGGPVDTQWYVVEIHGSLCSKEMQSTLGTPVFRLSASLGGSKCIQATIFL